MPCKWEVADLPAIVAPLRQQRQPGDLYARARARVPRDSHGQKA